MPVEDLLTGYYETVLAKNELITELRIPAQGATRAVYFKVTAGSADDWPALGVAVALAAEGATRQIRAHRGQRGDGEGHAAGSRRAGADRRRCKRQDACQSRAKPPRPKPTSSPTCAARPPTSANCCASMPRARCAPPSVERALMAATTTIRRTGRPLAAAARSAREGHRPRRIHPHHAAARHAACARSSAAPWRMAASSRSTSARAQDPRRLCRLHRRRHAQGDPRSLLRARLPRPADPRDRQGAFCRRAGRRGARQRSARRRAGGAADRRRIRRTAGGVRRGRGGREQDPRS